MAEVTGKELVAALMAESGEWWAAWERCMAALDRDPEDEADRRVARDRKGAGHSPYAAAAALLELVPDAGSVGSGIGDRSVDPNDGGER